MKILIRVVFFSGVIVFQRNIGVCVCLVFEFICVKNILLFFFMIFYRIFRKESLKKQKKRSIKFFCLLLKNLENVLIILGFVYCKCVYECVLCIYMCIQYLGGKIYKYIETRLNMQCVCVCIYILKEREIILNYLDLLLFVYFNLENIKFMWFNLKVLYSLKVCTRRV